MSRNLIIAASLMTLLWPSIVLPAGQPTAVSNLPVALTGRHKEPGKHASKPAQADKKAAGDTAASERK